MLCWTAQSPGYQLAFNDLQERVPLNHPLGVTEAITDLPLTSYRLNSTGCTPIWVYLVLQWFDKSNQQRKILVS